MTHQDPAEGFICIPRRTVPGNSYQKNQRMCSEALARGNRSCIGVPMDGCEGSILWNLSL